MTEKQRKSKKTENRQLNRDPERLNRLMKLKAEKKKKQKTKNKLDKQ